MMAWGSFFHPRDARGRESRTLWFVAVTWTILTARFIAGGFEIAIGPASLAVAPSSLWEYSASVATVMAVWIGREWTAKITG